MNTTRRHIYVALATVIVGAIITVSVLFITPLHFLSFYKKPVPKPQQVYDYYIILDEKTGKDLMYVPLVVNLGDELITEENKRYQIVKVVDNQAYARFVENITPGS